MKNSKLKSLSLILSCLVLLISLTACGPEKYPEAPAETAAPQTAEEPVQGESAAIVAAGPEASPEPSAAPAPEAEAGVSAHIEALRESLPELPELDIHSWEFLLANSYNGITKYAPPYGNIYGQGIDSRILEPTVAFIEATRAAGYPVYIMAGIRNIEFQFNNFTPVIKQYGSSYEAAKHMAPPSTCEHQTGLCIDVTDDVNFSSRYDILDNSAFLDTDAYKWMAEHCQEYGFIVRYPEGKEDFYGFACRNGHFRYVGVEAATYIMENDLCLEEFIALYDEDAVYIPERKEA